MREHQIGIALYCALGTGCRSGAEFRRCLRVATIPSSHEDHPRPPIHSGGSWPLYMLLGRHRCLRNSRPAWCSATSFRYSTSSLVHGCWPVPSNHHLGWPSCS
jgi:hypothetical protein